MEQVTSCTARLHYIGQGDKVCACGQLVTMDELDKFATRVRTQYCSLSMRPVLLAAPDDDDVCPGLFKS